MNKELLLKSDVLDIIFENRNKLYGAYNLRKYYDQRMNKAVGIVLCFAAVISALTFLPKKDRIVSRPYIFDEIKLADITKTKTIIPEVKPVTKTVKQSVSTTAKLLSKIKFVGVKDSSDQLVNIDKQAIGSNTNNTIIPGGPSIVVPVITGSVENNQTVVPVVDKITPMYKADVMPSYPGGWDALKKFLERNLHNPKEMEEGESVNVKVRFVVGYNGKLQSFVNVLDGGDEFNKEVVRVLKKMPEWIPGSSNGENVSVYYTIPIKFVPGE